MAAVYQWIRQIAVLGVISFLTLYLMGSQDKKYTLRFYLSLLMLLLLLRPASAFLKFNTVLAQKLTGLEAETEIQAVSGVFQELSLEQDQEILQYTSQKALSWVQGLAEDQKLEFTGGKVEFDETLLEQSGTIAISEVEIFVVPPQNDSPEEKRRFEAAVEALGDEIADTLKLKRTDVKIRQ
ncbi:MAG: stage III sporulation protein AF [Lachnospiraceae bacterium]|nr:stage III sporulation protein AF [Lachnospiraceae bacterium]